MKFFTNDTSHSIISDENVSCIEPIKPVTNNFSSGTDVILGSSPYSSGENTLPPAPPLSGIYSKFIDTGSTVQTTCSSEKLISSTESSITLTVGAQRLPLSSIPVVLAITLAYTPILIHYPDPLDIDTPLPLPPPPLTKFVARNSKIFKHRKSIDATFCEKQTTPALQNKIDEPSTSANILDFKTASDITSETFFLLYPNLSSRLSSTSSIDGNLNCESKNSSKITSKSSSQPVIHFYILRSRPIQTSSSSSTRSTSRSISTLMRQHTQPILSNFENFPSFHFDVPISLRPSSGIENSFTVY